MRKEAIGLMLDFDPDEFAVFSSHSRYTPKVLEEMEMRFDKQRQARRRQQYH